MATTLQREQKALFTLNVSKLLGSEYTPMMDDMARFVIIQLIIQLMLFTLDGKAFPLFSTDFALLLMFIVVGVMFYWLVFRLTFRFV